MSREALMRHAAEDVTEALFPETLEVAGATLPLKYRFSPGHPLDGLTLTVPLALLNRLDDAALSWLVPGMVREKVTAYFKALPKAFRNRLVPIAPAVTAFLEHATARDVSLPEAIRAWLRATLGETPPPEAWDGASLPEHLAVNVVVVDAAGRELAAGRNLVALRERLGEAAKASFAASGPAFGKRGLTRWDFGDLPETLEIARGAQRLAAYPTLVDDKTSVSLTLADTRDEALASTRRGVVRLIRLALKDAFARYEKGLPGFTQSALMLKPAVPTDRLLADLLDAIADRAFVGEDPLPRTAKAFDEQVKRARTRLPRLPTPPSAWSRRSPPPTTRPARSWPRRRPGWAGSPPSSGPARRARRPGLPDRHAVGAAPAPAPLLRGDRPPLGQGPRSGRTARRGTPPRSRNGRAAGASGATATGRPAASSRRSTTSAGSWRSSRCPFSPRSFRTPTPVSLKRVEKAWARSRGTSPGPPAVA
jgi:hypothetical protein